MTMPTAVEVLLLALGWAGAVGVVGLLVLRLRPARSVRAALVGVAVVAVASFVAGVVGSARAMFISPHDLDVVLQVTAVAAVVALVVAVAAGRAVLHDVRLVRRRATALDAAAPVGAPRLAELRDIDDELARTQARLAEARERERVLEASRRELVAWVSHDLRTPLAALRGMAEALRDDVATDRPRYLRQMVVEADRLSGLVDDLFELSRIQSGTLRVDRRPVDLRELVEGVLAGPVDGDPVPVDADPRAVVRAVRNLVENARRYGGGHVEVSVRQAGGEAVVAVQDACGGLADDELVKVFEPGWQGSQSRSTGAGGGLGLAVARGIARAHGGDVTVANRAGGCRFELRLPRRRAP